jgi:hypothetical protein
VQTLTLDAGGGVLAGGAFATLDLGAQQGIASFSDPPANTALPAISGTAAVKHTLSCSQGSWSGTTPQSYAYQWLRGTAAIPSATTSTYAVPLADVGAALACRVTATNLGGSTQAVSASVVIPGPPVVSGLTLRPMKFRAARSGGPVSPHGRSRVSYRLTAKATTTFTVQRALPGKRKGSSCVKPTKRLRHARKCTRFVRVKGSFSRATGAGKRSFGFTGRLRGHPLRAGMYRLSATAVDANGLRSKKTATHRFRIAR